MDVTAAFRPLRPGEATRATGSLHTGDDEPFQQLAPPVGSEPPAEHPTLGRYVHRWPYHGADGVLGGYACRFDAPDGKEFRPLRYGIWRGREGWHWKGWAEGRPLYRLPELLAAPRGAKVLVLEGEKKADAAAAMFPGWVTVSPMNGARSPRRTDWSALAGRDVVVWPDADRPGREFAESVAELAKGAGAATVRVVTLPDGAPEGWDLADPLPKHWTRDTLEVALTGAEPCGHQVGWPDPDLALLRPHRREAPALPLEIFGPTWASWIRAAAEAKGSPPDFVALPLLAAAGGLVANGRRGSPWPGWVEPPIVWAAAIGLPSSNKSPALDAVMDLVRELERELDVDFDERSREHLVVREVAKAKRERWDAEVRAALKNDAPPPDPPRDAEPAELPARRRLFTADATVERLARIAAANDRGVLLARDELSGWLGGLDKYGGHGSDRAFYLEAHGGRPHVIDRMKDGAPVRVPLLSVAVLGGIQPDRLASLLFAGDDDGCAARFLFAWPEPRRPKRPVGAPDDAAALGHLRWLLTLGPEETADGRKAPKVLPLEPPAADVLQAWREQVAELEAGASGLFCSWLGKLPGTAIRLAVILELLWWCPDAMGTLEPRTVSLKATHAALALLEAYALPMARRAFGEAALPQADRDAVALARWLHAREPLPESVNARELRHADALPTRETERYDRALAELEAAGWLRPAAPQPGPGRRRKDWLINPKLREAAR